MRNIFKLLILLTLVFALSGCVVWDQMEVDIAFDADMSGQLKVRISPVGSDALVTQTREADLGDMIYIYLNEASYKGLGIRGFRYEVLPLRQGLAVEVTAEFDNLAGLKELLGVEVRDGRLMRALKTGETLVKTNGQVFEGTGTTIAWPLEPGVASYKLRSANSLYTKAWQDGFSLQKEYEKYQSDQVAFAKTYSAHKLLEGGRLIQQKKYREAYNTFKVVLNVDPNSATAGKKIRDLSFVNYLGYVEKIPLPAARDGIRVPLDHDLFRQYGIQRDAERAAALRLALVGSGSVDRPGVLCRLGLLLKDSIDESEVAMNYRREALEAFSKESRAVEKYSPDSLVCIAELLRMNSEEDKAAALLLELTLKNPEAWEAYSLLLDIQSRRNPDEARRVIKETDALLKKLLKKGPPDDAAVAYELFSFLLMRNKVSAALDPRGGEKLVNQSVYDMIYRASDLKPDDLYYMGLLANTQLWLLYDMINKELDYDARPEPQKFFKAVEQVRRKYSHLFIETKGNLDKTSRMFGDEVAALNINLGILSVINGDLVTAESYFFKGVRLAPADRLPYEVLEGFYNVFHRNATGPGIADEKRELLQELITRKLRHAPTDYDHALLGLLLDESGNHEAALKHFEEALKTKRDDAAVLAGMLKQAMLVYPLESQSVIAMAEGGINASGGRGYAVSVLKYLNALAYAFYGNDEKASELLKELDPDELPGLQEVGRRLSDEG